MNSFCHNGIKLEYEEFGEGRPLVFLHGLGGDTGQISNIYEPFDGVRLIVPNQQGHGGSGVCWEKYSFESLADDVCALLDELGIDRACIAGISMGSAVALNLAVRHPQRVERLMLIRNAWTENGQYPEVVHAYAELGRCLGRGGIEEFRRSDAWQLVKGPSAYTRNAFLAPFSQQRNIKNYRKYIILPPQRPIESVSQLASIRVPAFVIANRNDLCHPFEFGIHISRHIPGSEFFEVPDKDTDPEGHRREINRCLRLWLDKNQ
jgi:pimeloyl-ACP methyl ester carboxylesterase